MANKCYYGNAAFGAVDGTIENIPSTNLVDGDIAIVIDGTTNAVAVFTYDSSSTAADTDPTYQVIVPDDTPATGRWLVVEVNPVNMTFHGTLQLPNGTSINEFSTDGTLAGNSDNAVPTDKAIKTYRDTVLANPLNMSYNPGFFVRPATIYNVLVDTLGGVDIWGGGAWYIPSKERVYYTNALVEKESVISGGHESDWYGLYIDASGLGATLTLDADDFAWDNVTDNPPEWSDSKQGWYGQDNATGATPDDRFVGIFVKGDGVSDCEAFHTYGNYYFFEDQYAVSAGTDIDTDWVSFTCDVPCLMIDYAMGTTRGVYVDGTSLASIRRNATAGGSGPCHYINASTTRPHSWYYTPIDTDGTFEAKHAASNGNTFTFYQSGFILPSRGC
jgi:hypothetical protein